MVYVIGWNIDGVEMLLQEPFKDTPRFFESKEEASAMADILSKDVGTARVLTVVNQVSDPA